MGGLGSRVFVLKEGERRGRSWEAVGGGGGGMARGRRSIHTPNRKRQAGPPETITDLLASGGGSSKPQLRLAQSAGSSARGVYTRAHTYARTEENTGSTGRETWVQMPAQLSESQLPHLQNGQHRWPQRALRNIRGRSPVQGHPRGLLCPLFAEGDLGQGHRTRGWHF